MGIEIRISRWNDTKLRTPRGGEESHSGDRCTPWASLLPPPRLSHTRVLPKHQTLDYLVDVSHQSIPFSSSGQSSLFALKQCCCGTWVYFTGESSPTETVVCQEGRDVKQHWGPANRGEASRRAADLVSRLTSCKKTSTAGTLWSEWVKPGWYLEPMLLSARCDFSARPTILSAHLQKRFVQPPPYTYGQTQINIPHLQSK